MLEFWLWRHPRPIGAAGRCIGRTDLALDHRRAKRLAHQIRRAARRHQLPRQIWTSALQRCALVGRQLARWGWMHRIDDRLQELDFGHWDGQPWSAIAPAEVAAWEADFAHHAPGGAESLAALRRRCLGFCTDQAALPPAEQVALPPANPAALRPADPAALPLAGPGPGASPAAAVQRGALAPVVVKAVLVVGHAGWINALGLARTAPWSAAAWPAAPGYGQLRRQTLLPDT